MTATKQCISAQLRDVTVKARENYAGEVFDRNAVFLEIKKLAAKGFRTYRIQQKWALDLSATDAAAKLVAKLKKEQFNTRWVEFGLVADGAGNPTGEVADFKELLITW